MNILLTGASGFLGRTIKSELERHHSLSTLSRKGANYNCDLANEVPNFSDSFDLVIHSAGKAHFLAKSVIDQKIFDQVNFHGTFNLLKGLEKSGIPSRLVLISSVSVYGLTSGINIKEFTPLNSNEPYGLSKIKAEELILNWCKENNVLCTILRLPLLVGLDNPPGNLGAMIKGIKVGFYFNIGGGKANKSMVLAEDVAKVLIKASQIGGIYNLTDGYHPSFLEISNCISAYYKKPKPKNIPLLVAKLFAYIGDLFGNKAPINTSKLKKITSDLTFDDSKARLVFGWNPTPVLKWFKINLAQ